MGRLKLLLDTHAVLWALAEPEKLSNKVKSALEDTSNPLLVSSISLFEIATKNRIGKLDVPAFLLKDWQFVLSRLGAEILVLDGASALRAGKWLVEHRDPFDRILAAQAVEHELILVSKDSSFENFQGLQLLW